MAEEGQVIGCHKVEDWNEHFNKSVETKKLVVVDFTASWCGPCRFIAPVFAELAKKFVDVIFLKVDVDELKTVSEEWNVEAMPTFVLIKEGKEVDRIVGADKVGLEKTIEKHGAPPATVTA